MRDSTKIKFPLDLRFPGTRSVTWCTLGFLLSYRTRSRRRFHRLLQRALSHLVIVFAVYTTHVSSTVHSRCLPYYKYTRLSTTPTCRPAFHIIMPKRKALCDVRDTSKLSVSSLDAAFDMLASETFTKIDHLVRKFETAAKIQLNDGVAKSRWEEACKRYWVTKAMEDLCCGARPVPAVADTEQIEVEGA